MKVWRSAVLDTMAGAGGRIGGLLSPAGWARGPGKIRRKVGAGVGGAGRGAGAVRVLLVARDEGVAIGSARHNGGVRCKHRGTPFAVVLATGASKTAQQDWDRAARAGAWCGRRAASPGSSQDGSGSEVAS